MSSHTPGPWVGMVNGKFDSDHDWSAEDTKAESSEYAPIWAGGKVIALVVNSGNFCGLKAHPSIEANAALIAAAPDLLKALNSLRSAAYWIVEGGEFAHWVNDKTMPLAAAKELAELAEMVQAAQAIIDKAIGGAA